MKLPIEYENRMKKLLGSEFNDYLNSLSEQPVRAFRVNTDKISIEDFERLNVFSSGRIPYVKNGFYLDYEKIGNHPYHHAGMIYVQEPAAMAPAECIDIKKDWKILDMCAAPGGKTVQLKNKLGDNGILISNEIIPSRCKILTGNIERLGLKNTITTCMDTDKFPVLFPNFFDLIMVDAPCSGEGMFRKEPKALLEWSYENVLKCAERQKNILNNAIASLKNGGYIIYSTCTFSLEENEMVVNWLLSNYPDFEIIPVNDLVAKYTEDGICYEGCTSDKLSLCRRFYPHKNRGEGQFVALLHKKNLDVNYNNPYNNIQEKGNELVNEFLDDVLTEYNKSHIRYRNGFPFFISSDINIDKGNVYSFGVKIGEIRKNYILPHHQFFMAYGNQFKRKINLTLGEDIERYLHGEEIKVNCENGWAAVTIDGCTIGGAKVVSGIAKNYYPKGLRTF